MRPRSSQGISLVLQVHVCLDYSLVPPANTGSTRFTIVVSAGLPCSALHVPFNGSQLPVWVLWMLHTFKDMPANVNGYNVMKKK